MIRYTLGMPLLFCMTSPGYFKVTVILSLIGGLLSAEINKTCPKINTERKQPEGIHKPYALSVSHHVAFVDTTL